MRNFVQEGDALTLTAPYDVVAGGGMLVGSLFAVAKNPALSGTITEAMPEGVFDLVKTAGTAWTQGLKVYWDNAAKSVTTVAGGNTLIGCASQAQASGDTTGRVYVDGVLR